jgi:hypothetical protein
MNHGNINKFIRKNPSESKLTFLLEISKGTVVCKSTNINSVELRQDSSIFTTKTSYMAIFAA